MRNKLAIYSVIFIWAIGLNWTQPCARMTDTVTIQALYEKVFTNFKHQPIKKELITLFDDNFSDMKESLVRAATRGEEKELIYFLRNEFNQMAQVLPLKHHNPEEFNNWLSYKQKDFRCMILGKKIQSMSDDKTGKDKIPQIKKELRSLLAEVLEIRLAKEGKDIVELEERLAKLKKVHRKRMKNKDRILQNRLDELIGNKHVYQW